MSQTIINVTASLWSTKLAEYKLLCGLSISRWKGRHGQKNIQVSDNLKRIYPHVEIRDWNGKKSLLTDCSEDSRKTEHKQRKCENFDQTSKHEESLCLNSTEKTVKRKKCAQTFQQGC